MKSYKLRKLFYLNYVVVSIILVTFMVLLNDLSVNIVESLCLLVLFGSLINKYHTTLTISEDKLVIKTLFKTKEFYWKDIDYIVKNPRSKGKYVSYGLYTNDDRKEAITIWIKEYKEVLKFVVEHCKLYNNNVSVDIEVIKALKAYGYEY